MTAPIATTPSKLSNYLLDPWSTVTVLVPSAAIQVLLHKTVLKDASLRELTLGLTLINTFWFGITLATKFLETPLLANVPSLNEWQKLDVGRHRFSLLNKVEIIGSIIGIDLFCTWTHRILKYDGYVSNLLKVAVIAPIATTAIQTLCILPGVNKRAVKVVKGEQTTRELWEKDPFFLRGHRAYITLETIKLSALAVAGLKFGTMLKN
ncbi:hypothetical protein BDB01DRAFT_837484 [Pilobolus umbonatus]|nr:hypothetical protein BDB01DRAFT_837484 [Pilobolus umbonatus]